MCNGQLHSGHGFVEKHESATSMKVIDKAAINKIDFILSMSISD